MSIEEEYIRSQEQYTKSFSKLPKIANIAIPYVAISSTEAFLIASALHTQWTKRSLYSEYKAIMDKLIGIGPIVVKVYYPNDTTETKTFQSVSDLLDWKETVPYSSTRIMPDSAIAVTVRNE